EDGIRGFHVTGVQTCALPISSGEPACISPCSSPSCAGFGGEKSPPCDGSTSTRKREASRSRRVPSRPGRAFGTRTPRQERPAPRSEERRVGKEHRRRTSQCE